jgi:hypothetical protein
MNIENFADLLQAARLQPLPQRLLFVFAQAELPDDASPEQRAGFEAGQGGALVPAMCVDRSPEELASFAELCKEATQVGSAWSCVFAAALSGSAPKGVTQNEVDRAMQTMVEAIQRGDVSRYLVFDRQGDPVMLH